MAAFKVCVFAVVLFVAIKLYTAFGQDIVVNTDKSDWVDPGDALKYDRHTQKMRNRDKLNQFEVEIERITRNDDADEAVLNLKAEWDECKSKLLSVYNRLRENELVCDSDLPNLRRYVRSILRQLGEHDFVEDTYYNAMYKVTPEDYLRLRDVESTLTLNSHDIYEVLERILVNIESTSHEEQTWLRKLEKYLAISLFEATQLVLIVVSPVYATWLVARMQLDWTRKVPGILLTLFLISVVWTWKHLYEQAIAEKAAELAQSIPPECNPQEMTWQQAIWGYFVAPSMTVQKKTACAKYHEMLMVNPLWTVPPTQALAVTVIRIVLEPAGHVGEAFNKLLRSSLDGLSWLMTATVITLAFLVTTLLIIMACGYRLRFPYLLGYIEPPADDGRRGPSSLRQGPAGNDIAARCCTHTAAGHIEGATGDCGHSHTRSIGEATRHSERSFTRSVDGASGHCDHLSTQGIDGAHGHCDHSSTRGKDGASGHGEPSSTPSIDGASGHCHLHCAGGCDAQSDSGKKEVVAMQRTCCETEADAARPEETRGVGDDGGGSVEELPMDLTRRRPPHATTTTCASPVSVGASYDERGGAGIAAAAGGR